MELLEKQQNYTQAIKLIESNEKLKFSMRFELVDLYQKSGLDEQYIQQVIINFHSFPRFSEYRKIRQTLSEKQFKKIKPQLMIDAMNAAGHRDIDLDEKN